MTGNIFKIGIDISTLLNHGPYIGAGRYIINLVRNLLEIDNKNTYVLTGRYTSTEYLEIAYNLKKDFENNKIELKFYRTPQKKLDLWNRFKFPPIEFLGFKADILHCPDYLIPPIMNKNIILTIHDLAFIRFPEFNFDWFIKKYAREVKKNAQISKKIIADSKSTKNDIVKFFKIDPSRIGVVYLAADSIFKKLPEKEIDRSVPKEYKINKKYILSVGTIEPRKNFITLIKAFNHIKQKKADFSYKLVITGRTGWKSEATYLERENSPYRDDILFIGRVPDKDLVQIYNQAELFVYPSLFEGFGLPPLEAMSCGLPVIASDTSSLKEVIGNAGILVTAGDESKLKKQILHVLENEEIKEELKRKSLIQAKKFSWEETARKTLEIYHSYCYF
ncbi:MAG: glycosyltransferase family 4 protein [Actinobacteria bacterium]|nr:glycosyltransferase family 4 protein [Chloroflexota bacterium]MBE3129010.1 glycosyltransferase family 4 protein [Actinomycetota bacterium]